MEAVGHACRIETLSVPAAISCWWQLVVVVHNVTGLGLGVGGSLAKALISPLALANNGDAFGSTSLIEGIVVRPLAF